MEKGDYFFFHVLNETLAYQVTEIQVVKPEEVSVLKIQEGQDLASIITCTPYGLNHTPPDRNWKAGALSGKKSKQHGRRTALCKGIGVYPVAVCVLIIIPPVYLEKGDGEHMKRKMMTRFSAGCLALLLTFGSVCSVQAAQEQQNRIPGRKHRTGSALSS